MRRGRNTFMVAAVTAALFTIVAAPGALAASPQDICKDLQDGKVDGTYTAAEWTAFFQDSTVQGYCSPVVTQTPPPVTPPTVTPPTVTPPTVTPPTATPIPPAVSLTPTPSVVVTQSEVAGTSHTISAPSTPATPITGVAGTQKTVRAPVTKSASAPLGATRRSGSLPFTGAQLTLFLLVGLGLVATGLVLRATGRRTQE